MKKLLMSMFIVAFLISCGGDTNSDGDGKNPPAKNGTNNGTKNGANNGTQNETNNGTQNGTNNKNAPCNKPVAGDGSQPTPLPVC